MTLLRTTLLAALSLLLLPSPAEPGRKHRHHFHAWKWEHHAATRVPDGLAIGDSTCVGFGPATGLETIGKVGARPSEIVKHVPRRHYRVALICAGTNPLNNAEPVLYLQQIRAMVNADLVYWLVPVTPTARARVLQVAHSVGDPLLYYTPSRRTAVYPHPDRYYRLPVN